jgi:hypothetical protein
MKNAKNTSHQLIQLNKAKITVATVANKSDGAREVVYRLKCDIKRALKIFHFVINEQQTEYRNSNYAIEWRVIRMFDSKTGAQICQES